MSKAYDRISLTFIEAILIKMKFPAHWIFLIMQCVSTVSFQLIINGGISGEWHPTGRSTIPIYFYFVPKYSILIASKGTGGGRNQRYS